MLFRKAKTTNEYKNGLSLLANRLLWLQKNEDASVILLGGVNSEVPSTFCELLYNELIKLSEQTISLISLKTDTHVDVNWDHDFTVIFCGNVFETTQLFKLSDKIDATIMVVEAAATSRHAVYKTISYLKEFKLKVSGVILHNFVEKVPHFIKRIFF